MATIPPNFDEPWSKSDVVLKVSDRDVTKSVHVNKTLLTFHSPFFKRLFNGDWKEKNQDEIALDVAYDAFIRALRLLHHLGNEEAITVKDLVETFRIGDQLDIPAVRTYCHRISEKLSNVDRLLYQEAIETIENRKHVIENMTQEEMKQYLTACSPDTTLGLEEVLAICKKLNLQVARDGAAADPIETAKLCSTCSHKLRRDSPDNVCDSCKEVNTTEDFETCWSMSNVALICWNADDRLLYVNEEILSIFCDLPKTKVVEGQACKFINEEYHCIQKTLRALHSVRDLSSEICWKTMAQWMKGLKALNSSSLAEKLMTKIDQWDNIDKLNYYGEIGMVHKQLETMHSMGDRELSILPYSMGVSFGPAYVLSRYSVLCKQCGGRNNYVSSPNSFQIKTYQCVSCNLYSHENGPGYHA